MLSRPVMLPHPAPALCWSWIKWKWWVAYLFFMLICWYFYWRVKEPTSCLFQLLSWLRSNCKQIVQEFVRKLAKTDPSKRFLLACFAVFISPNRPCHGGGGHFLFWNSLFKRSSRESTLRLSLYLLKENIGLCPIKILKREFLRVKFLSCAVISLTGL